jgi:hypothetical protein
MTKTHAMGWLKNAPSPVRLQAVGACASAARVLSLAGTKDFRYRRKICWYSFFFSANCFESRRTIWTNWILSASGSGG